MLNQTVMEHTRIHNLVCDDKVIKSLCINGENDGEKEIILFSWFIFLNKK